MYGLTNAYRQRTAVDIDWSLWCQSWNREPEPEVNYDKCCEFMALLVAIATPVHRSKYAYVLLALALWAWHQWLSWSPLFVAHVLARAQQVHNSAKTNLPPTVSHLQFLKEIPGYGLWNPQCKAVMILRSAIDRLALGRVFHFPCTRNGKVCTSMGKPRPFR